MWGTGVLEPIFRGGLASVPWGLGCPDRASRSGAKVASLSGVAQGVEFAASLHAIRGVKSWRGRCASRVNLFHRKGPRRTMTRIEQERLDGAGGRQLLSSRKVPRGTHGTT